MRLLTIILTAISIAACSLGQKRQLEVKVDLRGRHLTEIPDSVFQNSSITYLDLGSSEVTFYPPLSGLVDTNSNSISDLPEQIGNLSKLRTLILNTNSLTTLPSSIVKLTDLEVLDLSMNKDLNIVQQLDKLKQLTNLKVLKIVDVNITKVEESLVKSIFRNRTKIILTIPDYFEAAKE